MTAYEIIARKKRGERHSRAELAWFLQEFIDGNIADYQVAAWLMAVSLQGMDLDEVWDLTQVLANSGSHWNVSWDGLGMDKHSTGGVGDTTTLVVVPIIASLGHKMIKLSGGGLGHTGGTTDKLAAIPGLRTQLSRGDMATVVQTAGMAIAGQSADLAPADGLLYRLRDVTATVDSIPLIAASIMSKKIAAGARILVLDVKTGSGALMPTEEQAHCLADTMLDIAKRAGIRACALITDMEQPLAAKIGNALEIEAAIEVLSGGGGRRLRELCIELAAALLTLGQLTKNRAEGRAQARRQLDEGKALAQFLHWVKQQGGHLVADGRSLPLPKSNHRQAFIATRSGFIQRLDARSVGQAAVALGAGRQRKDDPIDYAAGIVLQVEVGSQVTAGEVLAWVLSNQTQSLAVAQALLENAFVIGDHMVCPRPVILACKD